MVWGPISYNSRSHLVFLQGKVNSARYIALVANKYYCHFFDRKVLCFFRRTTPVHIRRLLLRNVLFVVTNNCPGQQEPQISRHFNTYGTWWRGSYSFSRVCFNHSWVTTTGAGCLGQSIARWHSAPLWSFVCENTRQRCSQMRLHCVFIWLWAPLTVTCISFDLNLLYTPTIINYLSHKFSILALEGVAFFRQCMFFSQ